MTSDYATLLPTLTAPQALDALRRQASDVETVYDAYVVDAGAPPARRGLAARHPAGAHAPDRRRHHGARPGDGPGRRRAGGGGDADRPLRPDRAAGGRRGRAHGRHRHRRRRDGRRRGGGDRGHLQVLDGRRVRRLGARRAAVRALPRPHRLAGAAGVRQHLLRRRHLVFRGHHRRQPRAAVLPAAADRLGRQRRRAVGDADGARARHRRRARLRLGARCSCANSRSAWRSG